MITLLLLLLQFAVPQHTATAAPAGTPNVAFDNSTTSTPAGTVNSVSLSLVVGAGVTNGAIVVAIHSDVTTVTGGSCTIGGVNAPEFDDENTSGASVVLYGRATGNTTGSTAIACSWTTAGHIVASAISAKSVNQTTPFPVAGDTDCAQSSPASGNPITCGAITSATHDLLLFYGTTSSPSSLGTADGTQVYATNDNTSIVQGGAERFAGAASVTPSWPTSGSITWVGQSIDLAHI